MRDNQAFSRRSVVGGAGPTLPESLLRQGRQQQKEETQ
jgi:hypothetical protein